MVMRRIFGVGSILSLRVLVYHCDLDLNPSVIGDLD